MRSPQLLLAIVLFGMNVFAMQDPVPSSVTPPTASGELQERNKALALRFYEQVWFSENLDAVDEIFAPTYTAHDTGDRKGIAEPAEEQKVTAQRFWKNGKMSGTIDFQIAEGDLVATRWQWDYEPTTWWMKLVAGRRPIPVINVFRFQDGKVVEIWNHRHDIDFLGRAIFTVGVLIGLIPSIVLSIVSLVLFRRLRRLRRLRSATADAH